MTSAAFLSAGEWVGYYCYGAARLRFDAPMRGIRFTAHEHNENGTVKLSATGAGDGVGGFGLYGEVVRESGRVLLTKRYTNHGTVWDWCAVMTPCGIVGSWGRRSLGVGFGGWLWLWKAEWGEQRGGIEGQR